MNKPVLVDTDVMIDFLRGKSKAVAIIRSCSDRIILSCMVVAELYAGVKGERELAILNDLVSVFHAVPISPSIAKSGGLYKMKFGGSHGVGLTDALIAATVDETNAQFLTLNVKHFPMFKDLTAPYKK